MIIKYGHMKVAFHLNQLEKLIVPTQTTKMILWTMQQDKSFAKSPLFDSLSETLGLTTDQTEKIQQRRQKVKGLIATVKESLRLIKSLRTSIDNRHRSLDQKLSTVKTIATPKQTVQLLFWIKRNTNSIAKYVQNFNLATQG